MNLKFSKMHGLGNDFVVIDAINQHFELDSARIKRLADRHLGIGFDQMLVVEKAQTDQADFKYRIFNADGGEVSQCGNGARCFARFVREQKLSNADLISVETNAGLLQLEMIDESRVRVNMGTPTFDPKQIPLNTPARCEQYQIDLDEHSIKQTIQFSSLAIGNPHMVIIVDDVNQCDLETLGPILESHAFFPERVNVGFMQVVDRQNFNLRVFERGVGETKACGSGACAAMAAGVQRGILDTETTAKLNGGKLQLEWQGEANPVMMTGETAMVFQGEIADLHSY
ncbi:MAG: diaminopimelate epimerase [Gammaproteobacteria bacterium]|jgi:diaminopimelate epimerase